MKKHVKAIFNKLKSKTSDDAEFNLSGFILYFKNLSFLSFAKIITMSMSILSISILARLLGPNSFGTISYALGLSVIFTVVANLGIDNVVYKKVLEKREDSFKILGSAIALKYIMGLISMGLMFIYLYFSTELYGIKLLLFLQSITYLFQPLTLLSYDFLKDRKMKQVATVQTITSLTSSLLKIIFAISGGQVYIFFIILILENVIQAGLYIHLLERRGIKITNYIFEKKEFLSLLYSAIPLSLFTAFSEIYSRIDQIMIKHYLDFSQVGIYAAAVRVTDMWSIVPAILLSTLLPALMSGDKDSQKYKKRFTYFSLLLLAVAVCIILFVTVFNKIIVTVLFGAEYLSATGPLFFYIFSLIGTFLSVAIYQDLMVKEKYWSITLLPAATVVVNIYLNTILIPSHGISGAAIATAISYNIIPVVYYSKFLFKRNEN